MPSILVTGANGFVGRALCPALEHAGHRVRRGVRRPRDAARDDAITPIGDIDASTDWSQALSGIDVVIHLAGRAHVMHETLAADAVRSAYFSTNADGTETLARSAAAAGARRIVFVSSIKVNGESTSGTPYRESDPPQPLDDYGRSKLEAERRLAAVARDTGIEHVIVRPPLVYGPGVKGNLARLIEIVERGIPLPFGAIDNRRSLIGLTNLVSVLRICAEHPAAAGKTFLLSDGRDVSTAELVHLIAAAMNRRARLVPVPASWLRAFARLTGSGALARLTGSLQIDSSLIRACTGWQPSMSIEAQIACMVDAAASARHP